MIAEIDRQTIREGLAARCEALRGRRIFISGGTGFVGTWLLEAFSTLNRTFSLGAQIVVLTRDPARFFARAPHLAADPAIVMHAGDIADFAFPEGEFAFALHAATTPPFESTVAEPLGIIGRELAATRRILQFVKASGVERLVYTSSGAAYGPQPPGVARLSETFAGAPLTTEAGTAYGQGKRLSEFACFAYAQLSGFEMVVGRLFAFVGAYLPLDANFAVGNFIRDALNKRPIHIAGDGTPRRSYLYGADLAIWLWTMLLAGDAGRIYNVGSPHELSIRELAEAVAEATGAVEGVEVAQEPVPGTAHLRYVPDTTRAENELGLRVAVGLHDGIRRTYDWHRAREGR